MSGASRKTLRVLCRLQLISQSGTGRSLLALRAMSHREKQFSGMSFMSSSSSSSPISTLACGLEVGEAERDTLVGLVAALNIFSASPVAWRKSPRKINFETEIQYENKNKPKAATAKQIINLLNLNPNEHSKLTPLTCIACAWMAQVASRYAPRIVLRHFFWEGFALK